MKSIHRRQVLAVALAGAAGVFAAGYAHADTPARLAVGDVFPRLEGDLLSGKPATLPDAAKGKVAIVALGFSYDSRFAVEKWEQWFEHAVAAKPGVVFYQVPMMGRAARLGRMFIDRGMRKNTPKQAHDYVLTVYSDTGPWKARAGFVEAREKDAFLFLLAPDGTVRWQYAGQFDEQQAAALAAAVETLAGR